MRFRRLTGADRGCISVERTARPTFLLRCCAVSPVDDRRAPPSVVRIRGWVAQAAPRTAEVVMVTGNVKWFDRKKGYGFISGPAGQDVFVHFSSIESDGFRSLRHGETVEYELVESERGFQANHVRSLEHAARATA